jgi:hypothetical protein
MNYRLRSLFFLLISLFSLAAAGQGFTIKGKMIDGDSSRALSRGSISVAPATDTTKRTLHVADSAGTFAIGGLTAGDYFLVFTFTGYDKAERKVALTEDTDLGDMPMFRSQASTLSGVTFVGKAPPARQKGDTTELNASAFKVNPDATLEDLIKKAPGITVENGQVTAQGEQVRKVTIDGRQFFGDDATAALKNLPAEIVDKIQVFDRLSDQAQQTGVDDGNSVKSINIVTKANMRNGQFGRLYAGYGTDERYAAGGNVNIFTGNKRINVIGLFNNVNQQNFSGEDLLGVSGAANSGGRGGGGRGGGGRPGGYGGGGNSFQIGPQPGIAKTNAIGINFSDLWLDKKMEVSGSYFFNNSETKAQTVTSRELFLTGDTSQFYKEESNSAIKNNNHRLNLRLEYKMDSNNTLIIAPAFSYQDNNSLSRVSGANTSASGEFINQTENVRVSQNQGYNFRNELTYRHSFAKRGRAFSVSLSTNFNDRDGETKLDAASAYIKTGTYAIDTVRQITNNVTNGYSISPSVTWMEPLGKNGQLQFNYNPSWNKNNTDQENYIYDKVKGEYSIFDTTLSNVFENITTTHRAGVNYRLGDRENQFVVGINYQSTNLNSEQLFPLAGTVNKTFNNWLPSLQWRKNFDKQSNLRIFYRTSINTPSVNQLQNVINNSNPLFITTGNPFLDNSYTHFLASRYSKTNTTKGTSFFAGVYLQAASDYVTNATYIASQDSALTKDITLRKGSQLSKPINLDGYQSLRSFVTWGMMIKPIKMNLNLNAGFNYGKTPGQVNYVNSFTNSYTYTLGVTLASNISEYIDFNVSYSANFNDVRNTLQPQVNNKYYYHAAGAKINLLTKNGWFLLNDVNNQMYTGLADGFNQSFWLWNASVGKKFLKNQRGELKVTVFDLLKQNQSISRNVGDSYIEDVQTDVLQQYFMLTFTYSLRNFGKAAAPARNGLRRNPGQ